MRNILIVLCVAVFLVGCRKQKGEPMQNVGTGVILKVSVLQSGKVLTNENEVSLQELENQLIQTKNQNGVVWYYRENAQDEPPPVAMKVVELVVKHKVPISLSSKPDFSDAIDEYGISHPRE
jgi:biopolymer transport protein ExbD